MNRKSIIIGGSSGIGEGLLRLLSKENYDVIVISRRVHDSVQFIKKYNSYVYWYNLDIRNLEQTQIKLSEIFEKFIRIDLIINCAGIGEFNPELDFNIDESVIKTNVLSFVMLMNLSFNFFKSQGYGHLVNISSIGGIRGSSLSPVYNASKSFQINYIEGLRIKSFKEGIKINITDVRPGFVDTAMAKGENLFWISSVPKASGQIFESIKQNREVVYVTKRWRLISLILRLIPFSILKRL